MTQQKIENTKWLDMIDDIDGLTKAGHLTWQSNLDKPQYEYTGQIKLDFEEILSIDPQIQPFHTQNIGDKGQTLHDGMINNNEIGRYEFDSTHNIHKAIQEKFKIVKTQVYVNVQHPGNVCGIHIDKYRTHMTRGEHDFSEVLTKDIFSGVVFCQDWKIGQVFLSGNGTITNWKQGDTYTFPWYMPHGSANAGADSRYLIQFVGEYSNKQLTNSK